MRNSFAAYLDFVGTGVSVEAFDARFFPVGPVLRAQLVPQYLSVTDDQLAVTVDGTAFLAKVAESD